MFSVVVTGSNGGIGSAICSLFKSKGYFVVGIDSFDDKNSLDAFLKNDISKLVTDSELRDKFILKLESILINTKLKSLINNAAVQILSSLDTLNVDDFRNTLDTNVTAPLVLSKACYKELKANNGSIVNVGSIHSKLTKPGFISYATSKTALLGLTQAMAVDIGQYIRVNAIQPAATATEMLLDGFKSDPNAYSNLKAFHPTKTIATPEEIANAVFFLASDQCQFMNGTILDINGGIGARLHDPA